ncbi:hypothetical protein SDC9_210818 [bioreactor metagenome]|uniref:Uncharacterized protein n=1 Tax=bioreactor metagenome TaxID=1076179 RepID=A0A645JSK9_9ZZZZ
MQGRCPRARGWDLRDAAARSDGLRPGAVRRDDRHRDDWPAPGAARFRSGSAPSPARRPVSVRPAPLFHAWRCAASAGRCGWGLQRGAAHCPDRVPVASSVRHPLRCKARTENARPQTGEACRGARRRRRSIGRHAGCVRRYLAGTGRHR